MSGFKLFVSHAGEDSETAARIVAYLEGRGVACWLASRDIPPRSIYAEAITQAMRDCSACAVILSAAANASDAIKRELELASHYRKPFIPIRADSSEPGPGLDYYLRNTQWIEYRAEGERALDRIVRSTRAGAPPRRAEPAQFSPAPRKSPAPMLIVAALILAGLGGAYYFLRDDNTAPPPVVAQQTTPAGPTAEDLQRQQEEAAALAQQRDDALAAAEADRRQLAEEQARRERAERAAAAAAASAANHPAPPPPRPPVDPLGRVWNEVEFDGWRGTWTRRGDSQTFDGVWRKESRQDSATLEITVQGDQVTIVRTQRRGQCTYTGVMAGNRRSASGSYTCAWDHGPANAWSATIER